MAIENGVLKPTGVLQLRGGTAAAMSTENPILARREIAVEIDTGKAKIGNGTDSWNSLPYICSCSGNSDGGGTGGETGGETSGEISTVTAEEHNETYEDIDLGTFNPSVIQSGAFTGINPGGYYNFSNVAYTYLDENDTTQNDTYTGKMRVMHLDYLHIYGGSAYASLPHHIAVVPDNNLFDAKMNDTNTTEGGYVGSKMRTEYLRRAEAIFKACFGADHVLTYREYLINAVTDGKPSGGIECDCCVELMDERMIFGSYQYDSGTHDATVAPELYVFPHAQFAAFQLTPSLKGNNSYYWERNVYSSYGFCYVYGDVGAGAANASYSCGVRPVAFIC